MSARMTMTTQAAATAAQKATTSTASGAAAAAATAARTSGAASSNTWKYVATGAACLAAGFAVGRDDLAINKRVMPVPRTCCESDAKADALVAALKEKLGANCVITDANQGSPFTVGARIGAGGQTVAVACPETLQGAIDAMQLCVDHGVAVLPQGANTGLTGGSVPRDTRPAVVLSMRKMRRVTPISNGERVVCLAGAGILDVNAALQGTKREGHSTLGSTFLNPSVAGGVSYGSGGTQIRKGPAYTERALYMSVDANGKVQLTDTLGLENDGTADLFKRLETGENLKETPSGSKTPAYNANYAKSVTKLDGDCARFNADTSGPAPNRMEGKVLILATVHQSFAEALSTKTLWVSCGSFEAANAVRKAALATPQDLPRSIEYMDRDTFETVDQAGRGLVLLIRLFGMAPMGSIWALRSRVDSLPLPYAKGALDRLSYLFNPLMPTITPGELDAIGRKRDHNVLIDACDFGDGEGDRLIKRIEDATKGMDMEIHECDKASGAAARAQLFRFACAPAFTTRCYGEGVQGLSLDYALPKKHDTCPVMPEGVEPLIRMRYGHFGCNVVHEDLSFANGVDVHACKMQIKAEVERVGGKLPAEHGHGTEYLAPPPTQARWMKADPLNMMNPGVGGTKVGHKYTGECGLSHHDCDH